ncbi:hypothetical protein GQ600_25591 [Phytophthora cactorum]|nr:hypothetical protein GQ600_25591 [Phytophthora cactorum]
MGVLEFIDAVLEGNLATVQMLVHQAAILEKEEALRWAAWRDPARFTRSTMWKWLYEDSNIFMSGGLCMEIFAAVIL